MALKVLVVPDKFKGTLTAGEAARAIEQGWMQARPADRIERMPMSDGGDGFGELLSELLRAEPRQVQALDAAHRPVEATWWWHEPSRTAIIESARVIGLAMLPRGEFHPFDLDTFGLAALLQAAQAAGASRCLVGIGGSATNDGGFGLARGLGRQFLDAQGERLTHWTDLSRLHSVIPAASSRLFDELTVAVDVQNPLLGPSGCSRVYGPQKGLKEFEPAEQALGQLAAVLAQQLGLDNSTVPGTGAAGGLGFGLLVFAKASLESGFHLFARLAGLKARIEAADLVVTGEGAIDAQSLMGKGVGELADLCQRLKVPCLGLAGVVTEPDRAKTRFHLVRGIVPDLANPETARREPAIWLERLAARVAAEWKE